MAALTAGQRDDASRQLILKMFVADNQTAQMDTAEVRILIDAADDFLEANAAAYNTSIPVAVRTKATAAQKALAIAWVALKRAGAI